MGLKLRGTYYVIQVDDTQYGYIAMTEYIELTTVGEMLKEEFIEPFNLTQNALANAIFVPPNRIHQIIKGQRRITADTDLRLTTYFGLSQGYFLRYQEDYELRIARREIADVINRIKPIC